MSSEKPPIYICINCGRKNFKSELGVYYSPYNQELAHYCPLCFGVSLRSWKYAKNHKRLPYYHKIHKTNDFEIQELDPESILETSPIENRRDIIEKREAAIRFQKERAATSIKNKNEKSIEQRIKDDILLSHEPEPLVIEIYPHETESDLYNVIIGQENKEGDLQFSVLVYEDFIECLQHVDITPKTFEMLKKMLEEGW